MATFVALLRGVNVSGHRPVPMARLKANLEAIGLASVVTYKASGNVVFDSGSKALSGLADQISDVIAKDLGHDDVDVLVLRAADVAKIEASNPFRARPTADEAFLHVTFPFEPVKKAAIEKLDLPIKGDEQARFANEVIYLYCPHGYGRTKINNGYFEKLLGIPCTTRNWKTVSALVEMIGSR